jgi:drug/metabolite transporter superfamily protein YnfA
VSSLTPDLLNGLFEFVGGLLLWVNVRALYKAKVFKGVAIVPTAFFSAWGVWNLYFYPSLGQWFSFYGGLNIVIANIIWVLQMVWYSLIIPRRSKAKGPGFHV